MNLLKGRIIKNEKDLNIRYFSLLNLNEQVVYSEVNIFF